MEWMPDSEQEVDDALDFVGRAAVEGAERERVGEARRVVEVAVLRQLGGQLPAQPRDDVAGVAHAADERLHALGLDALEIVADAHVEHGGAVAGRERQHLLEDADQHRALDVLVERLLELELLRPLDVVADGLHVDAGTRDLELVEDLHRLQLEHPAAAEPGQHQVLRHLRVRAGGGAERRRRGVLVEADLEAPLAIAEEELPLGQIEDGSLLFELAQHARGERAKRIRNQLCHETRGHRPEREARSLPRRPGGDPPGAGAPAALRRRRRRAGARR